MYKNGEGVTQSDKKAFQYYKVAADKGTVVPQSNVIIMDK